MGDRVVFVIAVCLAMGASAVYIPRSTFQENHRAFLPEHWAANNDEGVTSQLQEGYGPDPNGVPIDFICAYRTYAYEFAQKLKPSFDKTIFFDSLMLGTLCNQTRPSHNPPPRPDPKIASNDVMIYVSTTGNDANPGSESQPKATVLGALTATRALPKGPKTIVVGAGTYYLSDTIHLTSADSDLTIQGKGQVWLSGAKPLPSDLKWSVYKTTPPTPASLSYEVGMNNQHGCQAENSTATCTCTTVDDPKQCESTCQSLGPERCTSFAWSGPTSAPISPMGSSGGWKNQCCIRSDGVWTPSEETDHISGKFSPATSGFTSYKTNLGNDWVGSNLTQLRIKSDVSGEMIRSPRARFPNANPETDQWPVGWIMGADSGTGWLPPKPPQSSPILVNVSNEQLNERGSTTFNWYGGGIGGPCEVFSPPFSYWCQLHPAGGGGFQYFVPSGLVYQPSTLPINQSTSVSPKEWTLHLWRRGHWANWMFDVESIDTESREIKFGRGGFQGCRGGNGSDWYIENELAFLDTVDEHYFDAATATLYRTFNNTPGNNEPMTVPAIQTLISAVGTKTDAIKGITISNIGFRDTAPTYMEPHAVPSGGDWALERRAAVFFEGTEGLSVSNCSFERLDGNGLMLSGYNVDAQIVDNEIAWTGGSALVAWGITDEISDNGIHGYDGSDGNHPLNTLVEGNIIRETGIWEKQASCWFQAKTARTTLKGNICFNLARAGFNFNDGFAGGDHVEGNLIYNSCRESADHGPFNSWDRQPYVTMYGLHEGKASGLMAPRNITRNFLVANYGGGNGAVDNDDGSEYYRTNHNFQVYGHQKFKIGSIWSYNNVIAYASGFGEKWDPLGNIPTSPHKMFNNTVIFNPKGSQQYHSATYWGAHDNHLYGPNVTLLHGKKPLTLAEWQAMDPATNDVRSTWSPEIPSGSEIVAFAKNVIEPV